MSSDPVREMVTHFTVKYMCAKRSAVSKKWNFLITQSF